MQVFTIGIFQTQLAIQLSAGKGMFKLWQAMFKQTLTCTNGSQDLSGVARFHVPSFSTCNPRSRAQRPNPFKLSRSLPELVRDMSWPIGEGTQSPSLNSRTSFQEAPNRARPRLAVHVVVVLPIHVPTHGIAACRAALRRDGPEAMRRDGQIGRYGL